MSGSLVFVDIETTSLSPETGEIWEVGAIVRTTETSTAFGADIGSRQVEDEHHWFLRPTHLDTADPQALAIGGFYERFPLADNFDYTKGDEVAQSSSFAKDFERLTRGGTLVGANTRFDERFLNDFLRTYRAVPGWHFRMCDVEALTQGYVGLVLPTGLAKCANLLEIPNEYDAHTALDDAKLARDVYDAVINDRFNRRKS